MKSDFEKKIILSLKGRVSKALNTSGSLKEEEKAELEAIFQEIDDLLLYKGLSVKNVIERFQKRMKDSVVFFKKGRKGGYIKNHILPLLSKISTGNWEMEDSDNE